MSDRYTLNEEWAVVSMKDLLTEIWRQKLLIFLFMATFFLLGVLYAFSVKPEYESTAVLKLSDDSPNQGGFPSLGQLGGLANIAGINIGSSAEKKGALIKAHIQSLDFFEANFYAEILIDLVAAKEWNKVDRELVIDDELYDVQKKIWLTDNGLPPSVQSAHRVFLNSLELSIDQASGMIQLRCRHISPVVARAWARKVIRDTNRHFEERAVERAEKSIEFLEEKLRSTQLIGMNEIFYSLIEEQTKTIMLAGLSEEFVIEVVDSPAIPEEPLYASRALTSLLALLLGAFCGVALILVLYFVRAEKNDKID